MGVVVIATVAFGVYGFATGAPSTVAYLCSVSALTAVVASFRGSRIPPPLVLALAALAVAHLAGGLVPVGDDVLYNASVGAAMFRYDHLVHSSAVFVGTLVLWALFVRRARILHERDVPILCVLAGLGLGAVNETIEFLTTTVHHGSHVGGYANTGWDLVSNVAGALAAGVVVVRASRRPEDGGQPTRVAA